MLKSLKHSSFQMCISLVTRVRLNKTKKIITDVRRCRTHLLKLFIEKINDRIIKPIRTNLFIKKHSEKKRLNTKMGNYP